jgi:hypothetical protein
MFYELLELNGTLISWFSEDVVCEPCGKRAEISATPRAMDIYWGCEGQESAMNRGFSFRCGLTLI